MNRNSLAWSGVTKSLDGAGFMSAHTSRRLYKVVPNCTKLYWLPMFLVSSLVHSILSHGDCEALHG